MANPISNDDDYDTPDHIISDDTLPAKDSDYNDDDVIDNDIVNDDSVDNAIADEKSGMPSSTPTLTEEDFDRIIPEDNREL